MENAQNVLKSIHITLNKDKFTQFLPTKFENGSGTGMWVICGNVLGLHSHDDEMKK